MFFNERNSGYENDVMGRENGNLPATNPNVQHLLLDCIKCHCQEWEGGVSRTLPALDDLACGVQGQTRMIYIRGEHKTTAQPRVLTSFFDKLCIGAL